MTDDCLKLDAYLIDGLPADEASQYAQHISECEACRDALEQQRWIDGLLQSETRVSLEPVPEQLRHSIRVTPLRPSDKAIRRRAVVVAAAAAAVVMVALATSFRPDQKHSPITRPPVARGLASNVPDKLPIADQPAQITPEMPKAKFVSNEDVIAVPLKSEDANVTIVQLYQTTDSERRSRRDFAYRFKPTEPSGG